MAYGVMGLPCSPRSLRGGRVLAMAWPNGASIMILAKRARRIFTLAGMAAAAGLAITTLCPPSTAAVSTESPAALLKDMAGTWTVTQRMWPAAGGAPIELVPAIAMRRMVGDSYLEDVMQAAKPDGSQKFTRTAVFDYNAVNKQYEYFSIDTRAPQMMFERNFEGNAAANGDIRLYGGSFVAPQWGPTKNAAFRYRLTVGKIENNRQTVRLYLTPQSGANAKEFLAFEYVCTRQ